MAIVIMALVNPQGQVVNKMVVETNEQFTLPSGWSMHEWTSADDVAYAQYPVSYTHLTLPTKRIV